MNELQIKAVLAGVFFGVWPLFMNRSGLNGMISSAYFSAMVLVGVLPFALYRGGFSIPAANWTMIAFAGLAGTLGILSFNSMLADASPQNIGTLFVLMIIVQVIVPASYQAIMSGEWALNKIGGYAAAVLAAYLLLR